VEVAVVLLVGKRWWMGMHCLQQQQLEAATEESLRG
jgi:hypothetical protein